MAEVDQKMQYHFMGKTGLKVSELCLGTGNFGEPKVNGVPSNNDEVEVFKMINRFVEKGGNFLDTANVYNNGNSEELLGRWLKTKNRDDFVIATKFVIPTGAGANDGFASRKHILAAVEASLKRLQTNYIDLYQMHAYDYGTPLEETLTTLNDLVRSGKVRYLGASNFTGYQLQKAVEVSKRLGLEPFTCCQPQYNLLTRELEWEVLPVCREEGLGIIPWSPLKGGILSGRYSRNKEPEAGSRVAWGDKVMPAFGYQRNNNDRTWAVIDVLNEIAQENKKTVAQVALRWVAQAPGITAPIIGARNLEQLEANLGAIGWNLTDPQMKRLNEVSAVPLPYPYDKELIPSIQRKH